MKITGYFFRCCSRFSKSMRYLQQTATEDSLRMECDGGV